MKELELHIETAKEEKIHNKKMIRTLRSIFNQTWGHGFNFSISN